MENLRERQTAAAREEILATAARLLESGADASHEAIAREAGMSARTVYRYFPERVALLTELWRRLRKQTNITFPTTEAEILPRMDEAFRSLDQHAETVHAVMRSIAGTEVLKLGGVEGRPAFAKSLAPLLAGLSKVEQRRVVGAFTAIYSAPFWEVLRQRAGLNGDDAAQTGVWILQCLLDVLHRQAKPRKGKAV